MTPPDDAPDDDRTVIRPTGPRTLPPTLARTVVTPPPSPPTDRTMAVGAPPAYEPEPGNGLPLGTYLGEFELTAMVGEGGFGIVYEAYDHSLHRRVALKEYMPSALAARSSPINVQVKSERHRETFEAGRKSFINEARLLASFDHPSLVKVYRFWEANGTAYMVMPFLEGVTLKDRLRELRTPPDEAWLQSVLAPVTEALSVIHAEQCFHRDIAPDNIMQLSANSRWLVLDFGAARRVIGDMTQALTVILKPGYAPIEQYAEIPGMKQGAWTDVYALAAVVHFAIMGRTPPPSVGRLLNDTYVPLVQAAAGRYSEGFLAAIDRALAVRPEARTQTIDEFRREVGLGDVAAVDPYTTKPLAPGVVPQRPPPVVRGPSLQPAPPAPLPGARRPPEPAAAVAAPAAGKRSNAALIGVGAAVALAAAGFGAYKWITPAAAPPAAVAATPAPAPASAAVAVPPPAAPAPPPAAPPVATTLDPAAEFARVVAGQTAGFTVEPKLAKTALKIGRDELAFTLRADRDGFLYVLLSDGHGTLLGLLPNNVMGAVKVKKGEAFRFPVSARLSTGEVFDVVLPVSDPPGPAKILFVVSALQRDLRELKPKRDGTFNFYPNGADGAAIVAAHGGPQPLLVGKAICPASGACDDSYGAAVLDFDVVK
jgi:serine/threonine protein kinase